jgi:AraC-like DNA-binding protein
VTTRQPRLTGSLFLSEGYILYVGPLVATALHAHHAAQIIIAPSGLSVADRKGSSEMSVAVIPPRTVHGHGPTEHGVLLFLDGDSTASRRLERTATPDRTHWARSVMGRSIPQDLTPDTANRLVVELTDSLDLALHQTARRPAVRRMCSLLTTSDRTSLSALSREAGLSARQMRHAFSRDVGLSMRGYLRWVRLRRSLKVIEAGGSLTAAAVEGGFADGAHLSRVFRSHFGMSPTQALGSVKWCMPASRPRRSKD